MPIKLAKPLIKEFSAENDEALKAIDEQLDSNGDPTRIAIRQATQGEYERRNEIIKTRTSYSAREDDVTVTQDIDFDTIRRVECFLTLSECNILDENDKPLFNFSNGKVSGSLANFNTAWNKLPPIVAETIHMKVLEVNPDWSPLGK